MHVRFCQDSIERWQPPQVRQRAKQAKPANMLVPEPKLQQVAARVLAIMPADARSIQYMSPYFNQHRTSLPSYGAV